MTFQEIVDKVKKEFGSADVSNYEDHLAIQINITAKAKVLSTLKSRTVILLLNLMTMLTTTLYLQPQEMTLSLCSQESSVNRTLLNQGNSIFRAIWQRLSPSSLLLTATRNLPEQKELLPKQSL